MDIRNNEFDLFRVQIIVNNEIVYNDEIEAIDKEDAVYVARYIYLNKKENE